MSPGWLLTGPKPAGVQGWGASGMMAGVRDCWVLWFWVLADGSSRLIGQHAEAARRG